MKIIDIDTQVRKINIGRSQISSGEIVRYGDRDDYPTIIASLIENSPTAKACTMILSQFVASGFSVADNNKAVVGKKFNGRKYTLNELLKDIAYDIARFGGCYVALKKDFQNRVIDAKVLRYEDCRFSAFDDTRYSNYIYYGDFSKSVKGKQKIKNAVRFPLFSLDDNVFNIENKELKTTIQVYPIFIDNTYIYPLSTFDAVCYDMNSEYHIQVNRQQELTQGMPAKMIMHVNMDGSEEDVRNTENQIKEWAGTRGSRLLLLDGDFTTDGFLQNSYKTEVIQDTRNANAFIDAEKATANNIRKACYGMPAVLIDYESGNLSNNSGEHIKTAYNYYARTTKQLRTLVSDSLREIFTKTTINFADKEFTLITPNLD